MSYREFLLYNVLVKALLKNESPILKTGSFNVLRPKHTSRLQPL